MTDYDNQVIQFEADDQEQEDNLQQKSGNEQNNEQLNNYDQNYNRRQEPDSNDLKPLESNQQLIQIIHETEEGFFNRIKGCSCRRQTDEKKKKTLMDTLQSQIELFKNTSLLYIYFQFIILSFHCFTFFTQIDNLGLRFISC